MRPLLLGLFVFSVGCAREREPAPTELKELSYYLFERWEEAELLPEAVDNMGDRISEIADTDEGEDGLALGTIPDRVADSVPHPDIDNHTIGVIGAEVSRFPIERHAGHIPLRDQVFSNPNTYDQYDREITEGSTSEFEGGSGLLRTRNEVITATFGVTIPYVLFKDYRWVEGERYDAIVARSWIKDASCGDSGSNCVEHTYSVDLWFQDGGGTANRATASWSQLVTSIEFGEDLQVATLSTGIQNVFEYTDRFLEEGGVKSNTARLEREIVRDGLEDLGTVAFGATAVVGDPSEMQAPAGSQRWHGLAVKGGQWRVFGRPTPDGDAFSEIVAVHVDAIGAFWDLYDDAGPVAAMVLPTARVLVVDGGRRTDAALLQSASEPDDLPWVLDDGIVLAGLEQHPAHVWAPRGPVIALFAVALDAAPTERASSQAHSSSDQPDEEAD